MNIAVGNIKYTKGYKYQLMNEVMFHTNIKLGEGIDTTFISLRANGVLIVRKGYASDGPSGPTLDTNDFMRGSLAHDAIAELCRKEFLDADMWFDVANKMLLDICKQDGMPWWRLAYVKWGINTSLCRAAFSPEHRKTIYEAP